MLYRHTLKVLLGSCSRPLYRVKKAGPSYMFRSEHSVFSFQPLMARTNSNVLGSFARLSNLLMTGTAARFIREGLLGLPRCLKNHSGRIMSVCTRQCEYVIAHRIKRAHQMFCVYTRLWEEVALRCFVRSLKRQLARGGRQVLLGATGAVAFSWQEESIPDKVIYSHMNELQFVYELLQNTVTCASCHKRLVVDAKSSGVAYCDCSSRRSCCKSYLGWVPFLERDDLLIWRKLSGGLYAYKLYGNYGDVTAEDFFHVQIDTEYRTQWDDTALQLKIVDSDPDTDSDVVYWEMQWPRMFSNRDYVFKRRYVVDYGNRMIVIMNQATQHPACPVKPHNFRVEEYWSYMVIKAHSSFSEPGVEFSLTYFDNAGVTLPSSLTTWVAISGLPDFMSRLRQAARDFCSLRKANPQHVTVLNGRRKREDRHSDEPDKSKLTQNPASSSLSPTVGDPLANSSGAYLSKLHGSWLFF